MSKTKAPKAPKAPVQNEGKEVQAQAPQAPTFTKDACKIASALASSRASLANAKASALGKDKAFADAFLAEKTSAARQKAISAASMAPNTPAEDVEAVTKKATELIDLLW